MYCNNCGYKNQEGVKFCSNCGTKFSTQSQNEPFEVQLNFDENSDEKRQKNIKTKSKKRKLGCLIPIIIVSILCIVIIISIGDDNKSVDVSESSVSTTQSKEDIPYIVNDNYFNAKFIKTMSMPGVDGCFNVVLAIENKSNIDETFLLEDVYVDDTAASLSVTGVMQSALVGKKLNGVFSIFYPEKIENAEKLEFKIVCMDKDSLNRLEVTDTITIYLK